MADQIRTDQISAWLDAASRRELVVQKCGACGHHQHHPRPLCLQCGERDRLLLVGVSGEGTVWSFTTVSRAEPPYTIALVRLDEGPVLLTRLTYANPQCDDRVSVDWAEIDGRTLPVFTRAS